jgi:hypothetical protein
MHQWFEYLNAYRSLTIKAVLKVNGRRRSLLMFQSPFIHRGDVEFPRLLNPNRSLWQFPGFAKPLDLALSLPFSAVWRAKELICPVFLGFATCGAAARSDAHAASENAAIHGIELWEMHSRFYLGLQKGTTHVAMIDVSASFSRARGSVGFHSRAKVGALIGFCWLFD